MKNFNFINSIPLKVQQDFKIWSKISAIILIALLILMAGISLIKIIKISKLKKEIIKIKQINNIHDQKSTSDRIETTQSEELNKQLKKLSKWKNPKIAPISIFYDISSAIPDDVLITEINYQHKQPISIKGKTKSMLSLKNFIEKLKSSDWAKLTRLTKVEEAQEENLSNFELVIK